MKKHTERAIDYFNRHHRNECYITSDGRVFHQEGPANSFAITLEDRTVEYYTRTEVEQIQKQEETPKSIEENKSEIEEQNTGNDSNNDNSLSIIQGGVNEEMPKVESETDERAKRIAELLALELNSKNYSEMMSLVKFFGLETKDKKTESLVEALTEYKSKLEA